MKIFDSISNNIQFQTLGKSNIDIAYRELGEGSYTLLFIHGLGNSMIGWENNIQKLSNHFRCIAVDLPGNGLSSKDDYPYSMPFFANCLLDFIATKELSNIVLVGHSMGGQIAMWMSHLQAAVIAKLILIAPAGLEKFSTLEKTMMKGSMSLLDFGMTDESKLKKALLASFYHLDDTAKDMIAMMVKTVGLHTGKHYSKMIEKCIQSMLQDSPHHFLNEIYQETLLLFGDMDAMIPNKIFHPYTTTSLAQQSIANFKHGHLTMINNGGHFVHWEKAREVNQAIIDFLSK